MVRGILVSQAVGGSLGVGLAHLSFTAFFVNTVCDVRTSDFVRHAGDEGDGGEDGAPPVDAVHSS